MFLKSHLLTTGLSFLCLSGLGWGVYSATQSDLFQVMDIQIESNLPDPPVSESSIRHLMNVPLKKKNLFHLNLSEIEKRVLTESWVDSVQFQRKLPHTLLVKINYRIPQAIWVGKRGNLSYIDQYGKAFGAIDLKRANDLPLIAIGDASEGIQEKTLLILNWLDSWKKSNLNEISTVSSISWDLEKGYRAVIIYPFSRENSVKKFRTMLEMGQEIDIDLAPKFQQLYLVLNYLNEKSISTRQVWYDVGKKVVVKTAYGS